MRVSLIVRDKLQDKRTRMGRGCNQATALRRECGLHSLPEISIRACIYQSPGRGCAPETHPHSLPEIPIPPPAPTLPSAAPGPYCRFATAVLEWCVSHSLPEISFIASRPEGPTRGCTRATALPRERAHHSLPDASVRASRYQGSDHASFRPLAGGGGVCGSYATPVLYWCVFHSLPEIRIIASRQEGPERGRTRAMALGWWPSFIARDEHQGR